jgi:hypothetical protein
MMGMLIFIHEGKVQIARVSFDTEYLLAKKGSDYKIVIFEHMATADDLVALQHENKGLKQLLDAYRKVAGELHGHPEEEQ